jgi:methionyl-tRNA formyltransferase
LSGSLRLAFAGTSEFAVPALQALARARHAMVVAYTQPDRPAGRGRQLGESPVKTAARELGIRIEQPAHLKGPGAVDALGRHDLDVLVVAAYGLILPQSILDTPRLGCINIHGSLLPRWRGAAPIQRAILAGDATTGVSIMQMEAGLDSGPVYLRRAVEIGEHETAGELQARLAQLGGACIVDVLTDVEAGRARAEPQDASAVTYARKLEKAEGRIEWSKSAAELARAVRAFNPWPVAETRWRGQQLRIWRAHASSSTAAAAPGTVVEAGGDRLIVACGAGTLALEILQLPGKRAMTVREFLSAHDPRGALLGGS